MLEVGAGPGLAGLLAAHYCKRVVLTDVDEKVLKLLRINAGSTYIKLDCAMDANSLFTEAGLTNVEVHKLAWGEKVEQFNAKYGPFDVIIGSGIV